MMTMMIDDLESANYLGKPSIVKKKIFCETTS